MWKMQLFECKVCKTEQEQLISNSDRKAEESCSNCNASVSKLEPKISVPSHGNHVSWSKWRV